MARATNERRYPQSGSHAARAIGLAERRWRWSELELAKRAPHRLQSYAITIAGAIPNCRNLITYTFHFDLQVFIAFLNHTIKQRTMTEIFGLV